MFFDPQLGHSKGIDGIRNGFYRILELLNCSLNQSCYSIVKRQLPLVGPTIAAALAVST